MLDSDDLPAIEKGERPSLLVFVCLAVLMSLFIGGILHFADMEIEVVDGVRTSKVSAPCVAIPEPDSYRKAVRE